MENLPFSCYQKNKDFLFGKSLFLGGFDYIEPPFDCNGNDAGMGKIAVKGKKTSSDIILYPNPANKEFSLKTSLKIKEVVISNSLGQILLTTKENKAISISNFSKGVYIVRIILENGEIQTKKLIIN